MPPAPPMASTQSGSPSQSFPAVVFPFGMICWSAPWAPTHGFIPPGRPSTAQDSIPAADPITESTVPVAPQEVSHVGQFVSHVVPQLVPQHVLVVVQSETQLWLVHVG